MPLFNFQKDGSKTPIYIQLKNAIKKEIDTGRFANMQKLPSRRDLADRLMLSTTTVNNAYRSLVDDGYAINIDRSGFYVKSTAFISEDNYDIIPWEPKGAIAKYNLSYNNCDTSSLKGSLSAELQKIIRKQNLSCFKKHGMKQGEVELRSALSKYLYSYRGIESTISDIIIGAGMQQILTTIVMILGTDKTYGFENPTDYKMYIWLKNLGINIKLVNITTTSGVTPRDLNALGIDVMILMPENQLPTSRRMSDRERNALAAWCVKNNKYIIEVTSDGGLNYTSQKSDTIYTHSNGRNVIYIEGFEYTIAPNAKLSFMLLPKNKIEYVAKKIDMYSPMVTVFEQLVYAEFINSGILEKIIKKKNKYMKEKKDCLISSLKASKLGKHLSFSNDECGMNFIAKLKSPLKGQDLTNLALNNGVKVFEMSKFLLTPNMEIENNSFVLGFAGIDMTDIDDLTKSLEIAWGENLT